MSFLLVAIFGAIGSLCRYGVAVLLLGVTSWPLPTFLVNVLGSFALGFVSEAWGDMEMWGVDARIPVGTGLMGGFTTYSAFDIEAVRMFDRGEAGRGLMYLAATLLTCLVAGYGGIALARSLRG